MRKQWKIMCHFISDKLLQHCYLLSCLKADTVLKVDSKSSGRSAGMQKQTDPRSDFCRSELHLPGHPHIWVTLKYLVMALPYKQQNTCLQTCNKCPALCCLKSKSLVFALLRALTGKSKSKVNSRRFNRGSTKIPIGSFQWVALNRH